MEYIADGYVSTGPETIADSFLNQRHVRTRFKSTTENLMIEIRAPEGTRGLDLFELGATSNPGEKELLLDRGTKFRVIDYEPGGYKPLSTIPDVDGFDIIVVEVVE
jgi:hypothetical protein